MKIYKLKHTPTGLYYIPSKGNGNLSTKGKIYSSKPKIEWGLTLRIKIFSFKKFNQVSFDPFTVILVLTLLFKICEA